MSHERCEMRSSPSKPVNPFFQVVRWIRKFPFSFISDREYVIARRVFRQGDDIYGITKAVDHPRAPALTSVVRMEVFYSMWRSRNVVCPWGSGKTAVETLLLHHEQFKIPENLSRFAVRHGMWGFVKKMSEKVPGFVAARRSRGVSPDARDPSAFGAGFAPNPPLLRSASAFASVRCPSMSSINGSNSSDAASEMDSASVTAGQPAAPAAKLRKLASFVIAGGLALLVHNRSSDGGTLNLGMPKRITSAKSFARLSRSSSTPLMSDASPSGKGRGRRLLSELD